MSIRLQAHGKRRIGLLSIGLAAVVMLVLAGCQDVLTGSNNSAATDGAAGSSAGLTTQSSSSALPHIDNTGMPLPVTVSLNIEEYESSNNPGPWVTVNGLTKLGGFGVQMVFSNNLKSTHEYTVDNIENASVMSPDETITLPKQPVDGGTGGNPFIWVQLIDGEGTALTEEVFIGRVVQGADYRFTREVSLSSSAHAEFPRFECANSPGPYISFDSGLTLGGLGARIIFRNNDNPQDGPHEAAVVRELTLVSDGASYSFPKQPVEGGVGGNPWIFAAFTDGSATMLDEERTLLGRCVQLSK